LRQLADLDLELARSLETRPKSRTSPSNVQADEAALLDVGDVAARLGLKPAAVRSLTRRGDIGYHRVGRGLRFLPADVEAYLARQRRPARGERAVRAGALSL